MKIAILICTRNRPSELNSLLSSIARLEKPPIQVVIASSGADITDVLSKFRDDLPISHVHTPLYGQIRQKILGIEAIDALAEWTLFLDDDVLLPSDTLGKLDKLIELEVKNHLEPPIGVGLSTPATSHLYHRNRIRRLVARIFYLESEKPGDILLSGHPVSYLESKQIINTKWLNGISAWNSATLSFYGSDFLESRYSAFEDVIFSYNQSKKGSLIFAPDIKIDFQQMTATDLSNPAIFEAASYWRLKFVLANGEFSKFKFLWSQIGRCVFFIHSSKCSPIILIKRALKSAEILVELIFQLLVKKNANWSLDRHCKLMK